MILQLIYVLTWSLFTSCPLQGCAECPGLAGGHRLPEGIPTLCPFRGRVLTTELPWETGDRTVTVFPETGRLGVV